MPGNRVEPYEIMKNLMIQKLVNRLYIIFFIVFTKTRRSRGSTTRQNDVVQNDTRIRVRKCMQATRHEALRYYEYLKLLNVYLLTNAHTSFLFYGDFTNRHDSTSNHSPAMIDPNVIK